MSLSNKQKSLLELSKRRPRSGTIVGLPMMPPRSIELTYTSELLGFWKSFSKEMESDFKNLLLPLFRVDSMRAQGDEYVTQRLDRCITYTRYAEDKTFFADFVEGLIRKIAAKTFRNKIEPIVRMVYSRVNKHSREQLSRSLGIDVALIKPDIGIANRFLSDNVQLIKNMSVESIETTGRIIQRDWARGVRVEDISETLQKRIEVGKSRARLIARDQVLKLNGAMNQDRQVSLGVQEYKWLHMNDERVRDEHRELGGNTYKWSSPPIVGRDGERGHPGEYFQCRCQALPVIKV